MTSLLSFQSVVARSLIALSLVHIVILAAVAWMNGGPVLLTATAAALLAATPVVFWLLKRPMGWVGLALAVTLVGQTSLLVGVMAGHPWQIEMHFYYFAILAMVAGFCEWRVLLAAAALIAVHHLSLNWLLPAAVFPGGTDIARVSVHAAVVVVETVMLAGIGLTIRAAFRHADAARQDAEQAARQLRATAGSRQQELQAETERSERIRVLLDRFQQEMSNSTTNLHEAAEDLRQDADRLGRAATHANAQSATAAGASEDTEAKVRSAAHAGEELAQTIADVGSNAARSSQLANSAVAEATRTKATIDELATVALEIDRVTDLISAIASQTNLLALNATIEAARAGEAGRGFAVVAQEVKALAGQTAAATHEIGQRIAAMKDATSRSVDAIAAISGIIRELDLFSAKIASAVEQQAAAAHQIAGSAAAAFASVGQVHGAIGEIEDVVEQTAQAAGKLGGAASHVSGQVKAIRDTVSTLTENLQAVRA